MSPLDDVRHRLHDNPGPEVILGEVSPIRLDVQIVLRCVVQVGNIQVDLKNRINNVYYCILPLEYHEGGLPSSLYPTYKDSL